MLPCDVPAPCGTDVARRRHLAHGQTPCGLCRTAVSRRPVVTARPGAARGYPAVGLVATEHVAGMVAAGEPCTVAADEYSLTRAQVLVACWWEARYGAYRRLWREWLTAHEAAMAARDVDWDTIPDPPPRGEVDRG